jgi:hypothetical protein
MSDDPDALEQWLALNATDRDHLLAVIRAEQAGQERGSGLPSQNDVKRAVGEVTDEPTKHTTRYALERLEEAGLVERTERGAIGGRRRGVRTTVQARDCTEALHRHLREINGPLVHDE